MGWYFFFAVLLLIVLIPMINIKIRLRYYDEADGLEAWLYIGIFRKKLFPAPKKRRRVRLKDYSPKALEKKRKRDEIRRKRELKKQTDKRSKGKEDALKKRSFKDTVRMVKLIARMSLTVLNKFRKHLTVKINCLHITVASDDASKTAVTYGCVSQSVVYLLEILSAGAKIKYSSDESVGVYADFNGEKMRVEIDLLFSVFVWQIISIAATGVSVFLRKSAEYR